MRTATFGDVAPDPGTRVPRVKGTLLIARMKFLRAQGLPATEMVLDHMAPADQAALRGMLLPSSWYPADLVGRLEDAIATIVSKEDRGACFARMGRFSADVNFGAGGLRRTHIHRGDPHHVLGCVSRIYASVYEKGRRSYERTGPRSAVIRSYDSESYDHCQATVGWLQRLVELSDATGVRVNELQCRSAGASHCEFAIEWTGP